MQVPSMLLSMHTRIFMTVYLHDRLSIFMTASIPTHFKKPISYSCYAFGGRSFFILN